MRIDFSPLTNKTVTPLEFSRSFTLDDLRSATDTYLVTIRDLVRDFDDESLIFEPNDPQAKDDYAKTPEEVNMGWSLAHLVLHVTASLEEGAAISSLLARGIPVEGRFRYEPDWRDVTTHSQVLQRIEESRRMCLAYLDTWPDEPHLDVYRKFAPDSRLANTQLNAPASYLFSLRHLAGHLDQFDDVARQARDAAHTRLSGRSGQE
jgi:hypothetical protein